MKNRTSFFLALLLAGLAAVCGGALVLSAANSNSLTQAPPIPPAKDSFTLFSEKVTDLVEKEDPKVALAYVETEIETNPEMMKLCHPLVHLIGRLTYKKYGNFATGISYQNDICGSGYLHGLIEEKFANVADPLQEMQTICRTVPADKVDYCYHGVGHGLMYYHENDLPESIKMCQTYQSFNAVVRCAEGVYMENFSTTKESQHSTQYLKETDPFYPCSTQPENIKNVCYFYTSIYYLNLHPGKYVDGLSQCLTLPSKYQYACAKGIGSRVMKENLTNVRFDEDICNQAPPTLQVACVEGLTSYHLINYADPVKTEQMCFQLQGTNQSVCLRYLAQSSARAEE